MKLLRLTLFLFLAPSWLAAASTTIPLDGDWQVAEGIAAQPPATFPSVAPVPGLLDSASPAFANVGRPVAGREVFWYRRTFRVPRPPATFAILRLRQALYGAEVWLNGKRLGTTDAAFTRSEFDLTPTLRWGEADNELLISVGADRSRLPAGAPDGFDLEKVRYVPGLFDSVDLVVADAPLLECVQIVPDPAHGKVEFLAILRHDATSALRSTVLDSVVRETASGRIVGQFQFTAPAPGSVLPAGQAVRGNLTLDQPNTWSPEKPFLYSLDLSTPSGTLATRFGLRSFRFDRPSGRAVLNGTPVFLRGTNVMLQRFAEDPACGRLIWNREWVRGFLRTCRDLNWNSMRWSIGFAPEFWYDLADEEGLLIQDEFPIWYVGNRPESAAKRDALDRDTLVRHFTAWIHARANHPSVVIWDAQNETVTPLTGQVITLVRDLDLSQRPWDNGWSPAVSYEDMIEAHPYFEGDNRDLHFRELPLVRNIPLFHTQPNSFGLPIIINEYAALWLHRDGTPTRLTAPRWTLRGGANLTATERQRRYARYVAALTEKFRSLRNTAGLMHIAILGYDIPEAVVCDHWTDVANLQLEPHFARHVRDAFAPVGLMIDEWAGEFLPRQRRPVEVVVINDLAHPWSGEITLHTLIDGRRAVSTTATAQVPAFGTSKIRIPIVSPPATGLFELCAELTGPDGRPVQSWRDAQVLPQLSPSNLPTPSPAPTTPPPTAAPLPPTS